MSTARTIPIIDTDSHVTEPPDVWTSRVAKKWGDKVPHVRMDEPVRKAAKGGLAALSTEPEESWYIGDTKLAGAAISAQAGWPETFPSHPRKLADAIPASYDASARLAYLDEAGIQAQVLFPNVGGLGSQGFLKLEDPELMLECVRAYNDFLVDWASADAKRLLPMACTPFWDVVEAPKEIERAAKLGHRGVVFTGTPQSHGMPHLADRHWDPVWETAQECGLPICFHVGSGDLEGIINVDEIRAFGLKTYFGKVAVQQFLQNGEQLLDLLLSGILPRFPKLRFISVESGIGWIPFILEAADYHFKAAEAHKEKPEFEMLPSEYFRRQVYGCYWFEEIAPRHLLDAVGIDNILFETDFPHPTCLYGRDAIDERVEAGLGGASEETRRKILCENAAELFGVDLPGAAA